MCPRAHEKMRATLRSRRFDAVRSLADLRQPIVFPSNVLAVATIIGIAGSLRKASFNAALLRAAAELAPAGIEVEIASIAGIPLYDGDLESERGIPEPVALLKDRITRADGLLFVTP